MAENNGFVREVAHRLFAAEFRESNLQVKEGSDQYSPQYLIIPTGAKVNRVFIVGTLTE
jgi:RPA family protein